MSGAGPLRLRVKDVLGVASADVPLAGITLIAGGNGAGKSSLLNACAAAALRLWTLRGARKKEMCAGIVKEGAEGSGTASLDWGTGAIRVSWPEATVETTGDADLRKLGTPLGIGAFRWMDLESKARMSELADRLDMTPTEQDICDWLTAREVPNAAGLAEAMARKIEVSSWDAVHRTAQEHITKLKGRWEQASGTKWGDVKVRTWAPAGLLHGEDYTLEAEDQAVDAARDALQALLSDGAVRQAEIEQAEALAGQVEPFREKAAALHAAVAADAAALDRLQKQLEELPAPPGGKPPLRCPHCNGAVEIRGAALVVPPEAVAALTEDQVLERAGLERAIADMKAKVRTGRDEARQADIALMQAEQAEGRLEKLRAAPKVDADAVAQAQTALAQAETRREAVKQYLTASGIYQQWRQQGPITEALSPAGVRGTVLAQRMGAFNDELGRLSRDLAGWDVVNVTAEGDPTYAGRPWPLLSESEKWRAELVLQVALAMREKPAVLLVDRLDVLTPALRFGAIKLLHQTGIPSLVAMTQPARDAVPDLARMNPPLGRSAWIDGGRLQLL